MLQLGRESIRFEALPVSEVLYVQEHHKIDAVIIASFRTGSLELRTGSLEQRGLVPRDCGEAQAGLPQPLTFHGSSRWFSLYILDLRAVTARVRRFFRNEAE